VRNWFIVEHRDHVPQRVRHIAAEMLGDLGIGEDPIRHFRKQTNLRERTQEALQHFRGDLHLGRQRFCGLGATRERIGKPSVHDHVQCRR
jgi:hypothetical protein